MDKLWLVKDKKGRIHGPYTEKEICFYIEQRKFKGEEFFCSYPTGKWKALSTHPVFYEKIVNQLQKKPSSGAEPSQSDSKEVSSSKAESIEEDDIEPTRIIRPKEISATPQKKKVKIKLSKEFKEEVLAEERGWEEESDALIEMDSEEGGFF